MPPPIVLASAISTEATPEATCAIECTFPAAKEATGFLTSIKDQLQELGFKEGNCVALVSTCRDEASRILDAVIASHYGLIFNLHGLAGVPPGGVLAVKAGCHHSPVDDAGKERYVFFGITHIGIDEAGTVGKVRRIGQPEPSGACGALHYLTGQIAAEAESADAPADDDVEVFYLGKKVMAKAPEGNIVAVTNAAAEVITETLEDLISKAVDVSKADYALITGIQVHTGVNTDEEFSYTKVAEYFVPSTGYAVVNGERVDLQL